MLGVVAPAMQIAELTCPADVVIAVAAALMSLVDAAYVVKVVHLFFVAFGLFVAAVHFAVESLSVFQRLIL